MTHYIKNNVTRFFYEQQLYQKDYAGNNDYRTYYWIAL